MRDVSDIARGRFPQPQTGGAAHGLEQAGGEGSGASRADTGVCLCMDLRDKESTGRSRCFRGRRAPASMGWSGAPHRSTMAGMKATGRELLFVLFLGMGFGCVHPAPAVGQRPRPGDGEAGDVRSAWQSVRHLAARKDKRILVSIPGKSAAAGFDEAVRKLGRAFNYEFERLAIPAGEEGLAKELGLEGSPDAHSIAVLDKEGAVLHRAPAGEFLENPAAFVERWKVPAKDARELLERSLGEARRTKRRLLVHLGAPW